MHNNGIECDGHVSIIDYYGNRRLICWDDVESYHVENPEFLSGINAIIFYTMKSGNVHLDEFDIKDELNSFLKINGMSITGDFP